MRDDLRAALVWQADAAGSPKAADPSQAIMLWARSANSRRMAVLALLPLLSDQLMAELVRAPRPPVWEEACRVLAYLALWGVQDPVYGEQVRLLLNGQRVPQCDEIPAGGGVRHMKQATVLAQHMREAKTNVPRVTSAARHA